MDAARVIDLFAGCGGLSEGFRVAGGFDAVAAVEMDRDAAATYAQNFGSAHLHVRDIASWSEDEMPRADVIIGGPPCQGFSSLGKRDPDDPRNLLWNEYLRVIAHVRPKVFVLENVPQFLASPQFELLQRERHSGGRLEGYELTPHLVNAADHGSAQARRRAVVVGRLTESTVEGWLPAMGHRRTVRDALAHVPPKVSQVDLPSTQVEFDGTLVGGPYKLPQLHVTRAPTQLSRDRYAAIGPGGNRFDLPDELSSPGWRRHKRGSTDVMGRLRWDKPSVTIRTEFFKPEKGRYLHPDQDRPITHYEAALIQGFREDFEFCGSKLSIAKQIGNAVPVPLGTAIARLVTEHLGR